MMREVGAMQEVLPTDEANTQPFKFNCASKWNIVQLNKLKVNLFFKDTWKFNEFIMGTLREEQRTSTTPSIVFQSNFIKVSKLA